MLFMDLSKSSVHQCCNHNDLSLSLSMWVSIAPSGAFQTQRQPCRATTAMQVCSSSLESCFFRVA